MKTLLCLFIFVALRLSAAIGDIAWVTVETNGWVAEVLVQGIGTNSMFFNGFGTNSALTSTNAMTISLTSMGFDDNGNGIQVARTIYGTKLLRRVYPNQLTNDIFLDATGTNSLFRVALSDYVFSSDSNLTVSVTAGAFATTNATPTNCIAVSSLSVTNNSTNAYPKVVANWSWVDRDVITNTTYKLRAVAFHSSGQLSRPVRMVQFWSTDQTGNSVTQNVASASVDLTVADQLPVVEYVATMSASVLTQGDLITNNFKAFPWVGDSGAVLNTADGVNVQSTPLYAPQYYVNDKNITYGGGTAVVATNGVSSGVVVSNAAFSSASPPTAFANISQACNAIAKSNSIWYGTSRSNVANSFVYLQPGSNHIWMGASSTYGLAMPPTYVTIAGYPTNNDFTAVNLIGTSGAVDITDRVKVKDLTIGITNGTGFDSVDKLWIDHCVIDSSAVSATFYRCTNMYFTRCAITNVVNGLNPFSTTPGSPVLIRGNLLNQSGNARTFFYTCLGNRRTATNATGYTFINEFASQGIPKADNAIFAYNQLVVNANSGGPFVSVGTVSNIVQGAAIVGNVLESVGSVSSVILGPAADNSTAADPVNNVILWNNVVVGQRVNYAYNETGTVLKQRLFWSLRGNLFDDCNIKADLFTTASANRIGNWSELYGVGFSGNIDAEITNIGASGFGNDFWGLISQQPGSSAVGYFVYVNRAAYTGSAVGAGNGSYRVLTGSPAIGMSLIQSTPYDLDNQPRKLIGNGAASGAYEFNWPRTLNVVTLKAGTITTNSP